MPHAIVTAIAVASALGVAACSAQPKVADQDRFGARPQLPAPTKTFLPTVNIAPAKGWQDGALPIAADGLAVGGFAEGLAHPRWLHVLPNGDVLVAETDAPPRSEDAKGLRGWFMKRVMRRAGSGTPSADRITLLRDADHDGVAELKTPFLTGLHSPFGMALVGDTLYVANADALLRFPYTDGATSIDARGDKVADLPGGPINHHWTKSLLASRDGSRLYVGVGSNSNIAENGIANEEHRAAILEIDPANGATRVFASGLRNPVGIAWQPQTGALWTVVNERDELGDDLVPDYMTSVKDGAFYGWPYSYWGAHVDARVQPQRPERVERAIAPDYALGAHTASLGLAFHEGSAWPQRFRGGAFVGQHGSWNRSVPSGYKVVFVRFENGRPVGQPADILTGFLDADGNAQGRPVGVVVDRDGALLVADDVGNRVWRVSADTRSAG
jgi:glucose/arabinose dehydrogenase